MVIWRFVRANGDTAAVRTVGRWDYAAEVTAADGGNRNWPELFSTPRKCAEALEAVGFVRVEDDE